jgi:hypothetical protein
MTWTAIIAVCVATIGPQDCGQDTALSLTPAPEQQSSPGMCELYGMQLAVDAGLVHDDTYAKVFCHPATSIGKTVG